MTEEPDNPLEDIPVDESKSLNELSEEEIEDLIGSFGLQSEYLEQVFRKALIDEKPDYCPNCGEELS